MFRYEFRHAFRLLVREPGFTLAALLTLALGVGANVAVFADDEVDGVARVDFQAFPDGLREGELALAGQG